MAARSRRYRLAYRIAKYANQLVWRERWLLAYVCDWLASKCDETGFIDGVTAHGGI